MRSDGASVGVELAAFDQIDQRAGHKAGELSELRLLAAPFLLCEMWFIWTITYGPGLHGRPRLRPHNLYNHTVRRRAG